MGDTYSSTIVHEGMFHTLQPGGSVNSWKTAGLRYESGMMYPTSDGVRFIYSASISGVTYVQVKATQGKGKQAGAFYDQSVLGFDRDASDYSSAGSILSVSLAPTKSVMTDFLDIYKGVLSVAGGPMALSITGMDMLVTGGQIKRNYTTYKEAAFELVVARKYTREWMNTFYKTVLHELFFGAIEQRLLDQADEMVLSALPGKYKVAGELAGVFIGKARGDGPFKRRLDVVKKLLTEVILKVADHVADKNEQLSEQQVHDLARHNVLRILGESGTYLSLEDGKEIIRETAANAVPIRPMFRKLIKAIDAT